MKHTINPKSYELVKDVWVTDANDIEYNHGKRLDMSKFPQFEYRWHEHGFADQEVLDKIGKNRGWAVCTSWSDPKEKCMHFKVMVNAKDTEIRTVKYEEICADYHWKSFKWSDDGMMILPKE